MEECLQRIVIPGASGSSSVRPEQELDERMEGSYTDKE
jgi:hypothetical protein